MLSLSRPLTDNPLAVFDLETTGLFAQTGDRVCEIAVLRSEPGTAPRMFETLINPGRDIHPDASAVSGITDAHVRDAPAFADVVDTVTELMSDAVLVAHNAPFDVGFLAAEYAVACQPPPAGPVVDTLALARKHFRFRNNNLFALAREFGVRPGRSHRAGGDVETTYRVLMQMIQRLSSRFPTAASLIASHAPSVDDAWDPRPRHLPMPLQAAIDRRAPVTICYTDAAGRSSERTVEPLWANDDYLIAYCRSKKGQRTFRLDRIQDAWLS